MTRYKGRLLRTAAMMGLLVAVASCGRKTVVDEEHTFAHNVWNRFTPEHFEAAVPDNEAFYNFDLSTSVDTALFRYESLPLTVKIYGAQGEHRMFYAEIPLKKEGRWRGEMVEGYRVVVHRVKAMFSFNAAGDYRIDIGQATSQYDLEGVHSIGLHIVRAKMDYDMD